MSEQLSPARANETLDRMGALSKSKQPGVYALKLDTPNTVLDARNAWEAESDVLPSDGDLEAIADAARVAYVGASSNVYGRIMEHAKGEKRQAAYLQVFAPVGIVDVWPADNPREASEYNRAVFLAESGWVVVTDGEVITGG